MLIDLTKIDNHLKKYNTKANCFAAFYNGGLITFYNGKSIYKRQGDLINKLKWLLEGYRPKNMNSDEFIQYLLDAQIIIIKNITHGF